MNDKLWRKKRRGPIRYRPEVPQYATWIWSGFAMLSRQRQPNGMAFPRISVADTVAYLDLIGENDPERRIEFAQCVSALDARLYLLVMDEKEYEDDPKEDGDG